MTPTQIAELEAEFIRRAHAEKATGDNLTASTWQLAAALLIEAGSKGEATPLLTSKELAPLIGLSWKVVHEWKGRGIIPAAIDEPGCLRFDLAEVREALAARAATANAA